jgi:N-methylhydantoinase A
VGAGIHRASRLHKGKGYVLRIPSIDIAEIGAGGGSIVWQDKGGLLNVGPRSQGASPGPICYDRGGEEPTLTDSYVILGYMNPEYLLGGDFVLNAEKARRIYEAKVARSLDIGLLEAAYGVYAIANSNIRRAITSVSSERGRDPRKFSLFVFGGAGALHGAAVAKSMGMKEVIVAPLAGIFSAFGLLCADIQRMYTKAFDALLEPGAVHEANQVLDEMIREALRSADEHGYSGSATRINRFADLRYRRQQSELTIPLPDGKLEERHVLALYESFHREYELTFGFRLANTPVEVVNLRVSSTIAIPKPVPDVFAGSNGRKVKQRSRPAFFGAPYGLIETPVVRAEEITSADLKGPVLIDTYDSTILVPPDARITRSPQNNLTIRLN